MESKIKNEREILIEKPHYIQNSEVLCVIKT